MATWPSDLPQYFEADSYSYEPGSGVIRTAMDAGPPKVRRRFTAVYNIHRGAMVMSRTQFTTYFQPFIDVTIGGGALAFDFPNPIDDGETTIEARFLFATGQPPYIATPFSAENLMVSFALEELAVDES